MSTVEAVKEGKMILGRGKGSAMGLLLTANFVGAGFGNVEVCEAGEWDVGVAKGRVGEECEDFSSG